jgi:DNA polymerase III epsilon subunit-like protein
VSQYPEHEKLKALNGANQIVGNFIEWLYEQHIDLAKWDGDSLYPINKSRDDLLAEHFGIDRNVLEQEKQAMLDEIRKMNDDHATTLTADHTA